MTRRDEAVRAAWQACGEPMEFPRWFEAFAEWDVMPVEVGGKVVGAVFAKGAEIHVGVLPEYHRRWCTPKLWRWAVTDRQKQYGPIYTVGEPDNKFIARAGFVPVREYKGFMVFVRP